MFEEWNTAYIHVLLNNTTQGGGGTLTVFMCYGINIWCVRESPDSFNDGLFVPDKEWNAAYIHVYWAMPDMVEEELSLYSCVME